ncbi:hypothetical protein FRB95_014286 [Tulasnella sp. JGI-2019a]|nr:hypothetical protein FRB95_014286 [Tulasnella sp. JGI-2019a]
MQLDQIFIFQQVYDAVEDHVGNGLHKTSFFNEATYRPFESDPSLPTSISCSPRQDRSSIGGGWPDNDVTAQLATSEDRLATSWSSFWGAIASEALLTRSMERFYF